MPNDMTPKVDKTMFFDNVPDNKSIADSLVEGATSLKDKFVKLGGKD